MRDTMRLLLNISNGRIIRPPPFTALSISLVLSLKYPYRAPFTLSGETTPARAEAINNRIPIATIRFILLITVLPHNNTHLSALIRWVSIAESRVLMTFSLPWKAVFLLPGLRC
jgi:hypothetical protein